MNGHIKLKLGNIPPELIFVILGLIYGLAFLFVTPPFQVLDEDSHFFKAMGVSEGYWISEKVGDKAGVYIPEGAWELVKAFFPQTNSYFKEKLKVEDITSKLNITQDKDAKHFADLSNTAVVVYSPVPYVMAAFAITAGTFFNLPPLILMYLAKLANLLVWVFLVYLAIRIIPVHKWVLLMFALMPMTIFEAASISADSLTIALSFLLIAYIFKLAFDNHNFTKTNFLILIVLGLLMALTKSIYVFLFFLFLLIPADRFKNYKKKYGIFFIIFILIGLVSGGWILLSNGLYVPIFPTWSITGQIYFVLNHPLTYLTILSETFIKHGIFYLTSFVGYIGRFGISLPFILVLVYYLVLIFVAMLDENEFKVNLRQKLICLIIFIVSIFAIMTFDFLTWNPVGNNDITGVQGRYFIPIAPLLWLLFYNKRKHVLIFNKDLPLKMNNHYKFIIVEIIIITLSLTLFMLINGYYLPN